MFKEILGKIFGTIELFTKTVAEYEWDPDMKQMLRAGDPYQYPAYISIAKRQKEVRFVMEREYELLMKASMNNSISEINQVNSYIVDNPTEFYKILDYGKEKGNEVFITNNPYGFSITKKILVLGDTITVFYDFDEQKQHYRKSKSFIS